MTSNNNDEDKNYIYNELFNLAKEYHERLLNNEEVDIYLLNKKMQKYLKYKYTNTEHKIMTEYLLKISDLIINNSPTSEKNQDTKEKLHIDQYKNIAKIIQ